MKKILLSVFSFIFFFFFVSTEVKAEDYNGNLGYTYSTSSTIFWFVTDNENFDKIYLHIESLESVEMEEYASGIYMYAYGGDLKNKEYHYSVCDGLECSEVIDPFSKVLNKSGTRSVIVANTTTNLEGWGGVNTISVSSYNKSIYAIEPDKFAETLTLKDNTDSSIPNSIFSKISYPSQYYGTSTQKYVGYEYLEQMGIKYLEIGDLYDENNYFSPNLNFCVDSCDKELKNAILNFKKIKLNVIGRVDFLNLNSSLENTLKAYSQDYVLDHKINLENPIMRQYIKDVFIHWIKEYKLDGFYILNAQSYGSEYLNQLKQLLLQENPNLFIYTDNSIEGQYHTSDKLQEALFGELTNATSKGIASNDFSKEKFDNFIDGLFGGYYNNKSKYENASKVINNIGDFNGLDIYSKMALTLAISVSDTVIKDKISLALMSIFSSVGIPRLIAGSEFFNNNIIPTGDIDSIETENKVCRENTKLCYRVGDNKKLDWISLINNDTETLSFMTQRNKNIANYPSIYSMSNSSSMSYDANLINKGVFLLTFDYPGENVGEYEQTKFIINFSDVNQDVNVNLDGKGISYSKYLGNIVNVDDKQYIQAITLVTITQRKVNNTPSWVYILIMFALLLIIFGTRYICIKFLKTKYNIEYDEYTKQNRLKAKKSKKKKEQNKGDNVFKQFLSDEPLFNKLKKKVQTRKEASKVKNKETETKEEPKKDE